MFETLRSHRVV